MVTKRADSMTNSQKSRYPDPRTGKDHASAHVRHEKRSPFCHQCASVPPLCPAVSVSVPFHSVSRNMHPWVLSAPNTAPQPLPESTPALSRMLTPSIRHPALIPCPAEDLSRALEITQHPMLSLAPSQRPPAPSCLRQICSHENSPSNHESMKKPRRSGPCKSTDRNCAPSRRNSQGFSGHNPLCSVIFFSSYPDCQVPSWECSDSDSTCCSAQETPSGAWDPA